jgi:2-phospho-L-lactate guanylyltransferase
VSCWALIAVKERAAGKQRLASTLNRAARSALVEDMLTRVVHATRLATTIDHVAIVSPERSAIDSAVTWLPDSGLGLNSALDSAAHALAGRGADELLILPGDLPLLTAREVDELITRGRSCGVALAPDRQRLGTNAIYTRLPCRFEWCFGVESWARHLAGARLACDPAIVVAPGLAFDVDEPDDLTLWPVPLPPLQNRVACESAS